MNTTITSATITATRILYTLATGTQGWATADAATIDTVKAHLAAAKSAAGAARTEAELVRRIREIASVHGLSLTLRTSEYCSVFVAGQLR